MVTESGDFHHPYALYKGISKEEFLKMKAEVLELVHDAVKPKDAVMAIFHVTESAWYDWQDYYVDDLEKGYNRSESRLICLLDDLRKKDVTTQRLFTKRMKDLSLKDGNVEATKFMLERRYGFKKESRKAVDVSTSDDFNFNINITNSEDEK